MNTSYVPAATIESLKEQALEQLNSFARKSSQSIEGFQVKEIKFGNIFSNDAFLCIEIFVILDDKSKLLKDNTSKIKDINAFLNDVSFLFLRSDYAKYEDIFPVKRLVRESQYYA